MSNNIPKILFCGSCKMGKHESKGQWVISGFPVETTTEYAIEDFPDNTFQTWLCNDCLPIEKDISKLKGISLGGQSIFSNDLKDFEMFDISIVEDVNIDTENDPDGVK